MALNATMRALMWHGMIGNVTVTTVPKPNIESASDALIRIRVAGICGSDLHTYRGFSGPNDVPWLIGHEGLGVVEAVGKAVKSHKVGDYVVIPDGVDDGHIKSSGKIERPIILGTGLGHDGCQAEYVRVPYADVNLISIPPLNSTGPDGPRDIDYMLVGDIFATAWTVLNWSGFQAGDKVAVFGAGPVGLLTAYSALLRGASRVYSIDYVPQRLQKAASIGAIPINFKEKDPKDELARLEPDGVERSVDCVGFESVGRDLKRDSSIILRNMVNVTRYGGGIGVVGVYWTQPKTRGAPLANEISDQSLSIASAFMKALTYRGGVVDPRTVAPELVRLVASGKAKPGFVISDTYNIEKGPEAYARFSNKEIIKPVLRFS